MFVQLVLDPIWQSYAIWTRARATRPVVGLANSWGSRSSPRRSRGRSPQACSGRCCPLSLPLCDSVMGMVVEHLPDTVGGRGARFRALLSLPGWGPPGGGRRGRGGDGLRSFEFGPDDAETVGFVCPKMVALPAESLPAEHRAWLGVRETAYLAFGRIFAGTLSVGQTVHVLSPSYDPSDPGRGRKEGKVAGLFLMKGRDVDALPAAGAGNMVAIAGLGASSTGAPRSSTPTMRPLGANDVSVGPPY